MNTVTIFRGTLPKNFLGNVIYQFQLPCSCTALHIRLICHLQDRKEAAFLHEKEAEAAFLDHCGRLPDAQEKERLLAQMKTEIQLADTVMEATGHSYENGKCTVCGEIDPDFKAVIIEGANGEWQKGTKDGLSFTSNAAFAHFHAS